MDFTHPHFAEPRWLWLAVIAPLALLALYWHAARGRRRQLATLATPHFLTELTRSHSPLRRTLKHTLLVAAVTSIGLALARPQWGEQHLDSKRLLGEDVVFALDCSRSMLASDVSPSRLERARLAMLDFVQRHGRGRVGLVAFSGQAFLQCPLTFDYNAFEEALRAVDDKTIVVPGTDVGRALEEAIHAMDKNSRRKIILLLTDGEDLEKGGVRTAEKLAEQGAVVYTIGVGTPAGAEIRVINERGVPELVRDAQGEVVRSRLDEPTLRAIAQATRGGYFPLGALGEGLARVRSALLSAEKNADAAAANKLGVDRFHVFLAVVLILLVTESLLGTRKRLLAG
jgi:Ca-activated chloride channel family protein